MALVIALVMCMSMVAFAADGDPVHEGSEPAVGATTPSTPSITIVPNNTADETESLAINYTYYQILEASCKKGSPKAP